MLSRLAPALLIAVALIALAITAVLGVTLNDNDWASGALFAGIACLGLGGICLIAMLVRVGTGHRARRAILLSLAAILTTATLGGVGLVVSTPLHIVQARSLEAAHQWSDAIHEYELGGERAPASHDLARVYDEWGDELQASGRYTEAIGKYDMVINTFSEAAAELQRARVSEARVRFEYGTQLSAEGQYGQAIMEFETITSEFADSAYAARAHAAAATARYTRGQQLLAQQLVNRSACEGALLDYETLASKYADTPEGAKAKAALAAGVDVTGVLTNYPTDVPITMYLSKTIRGNPAYHFSEDYSAGVRSNGQFSFTSVQQGNYNLFASKPDGTGWYWYYSKDNLYTVTVCQLCTVDAGTYDYGDGFYQVLPCS
jgi:tetratricopeptide (TPR) repeat protein